MLRGAAGDVAALPAADFRRSGGVERLRGKDSNLDYLIQSQASYH
jgi:hypothetical protein